MKNLLNFFVAAALVFFTSTAFAESSYPQTLENGNLVLVDGGMGVGYYADKSSVSVDKYAPPFYELSIDILPINFSDKYYRENETYIGGPYVTGEIFRLYFKYNWDTKTVFHKNDKIWKVWDINRSYSHAEGNPMIPYAAEVAFVWAYNLKFFGNVTGADGYRVIDESLYDALGI